jgi:hypothetical protein
MSAHRVQVEDPRLRELRALMAYGVALPMPPARILELEDAGWVVDLATGDIAPATTTVAPTPSGRAVAYLLTPKGGSR